MVQGEVDFESDLAADFGAGDVATAKDGEGDGDGFGELIPASAEALYLIFTQATIAGGCSVDLGSEAQAAIEVVHEGEASGEDVAARGLHAKDAGAGVAGEELSEVGNQAGLVGEGLLGNGVQPVVSFPGAEFLFYVARGEFDVEAGREGRGA